MMPSYYCFICKQELLEAGDYVTLREKDALTINITSKKRNDDINVSSGDKVHVTCRREYTKFQCVEKGINVRPPPKRELRSSDVAFNFKEHCLFSLQGDKYSGKKTTTKLVPVRTFEFQESVKKIWADRKDEWSQQVMLRIRSV